MNDTTLNTQFHQMLLKPKPWYRRHWLILLLSIASPVILATLWFSHVFSTSSISSQRILIDASRPDAWIRSQNLSQLPRDMLTVPLIKDVLTEDFLYFYETDEDWLSLKGSMRRISFEHQLNWKDNLVQSLAQSPADIYLWRDSSGALGYWAIGIERNGLKGVAQQIAQIKLNMDKQLSQIGSIKVDGDNVSVLQIKLSPRRTMVFAAHGERLALVSDVGMLRDEQGKLSRDAENLLEGILSEHEKTRHKIAPDLIRAHTEGTTQSIALSSRFFAQGYAAIIPQVQGLSFDYDGKTWQSQVNLAENIPAPDLQIWQQIPSNAAWCVATTIDWEQVQKSLKPIKHFKTNPNLTALFKPTGAACWYADKSSSVTKPLIIAQLNELSDKTIDKTETLSELFNWGISTNKAYLADVRHAANLLRQENKNLTQLESRQESLEKEMDNFNKNDWNQRKKDLNADITALKKRMDQEENNSSSELIQTLKEKNQENLIYYNKRLEELEAEPAKHREYYQKALTDNTVEKKTSKELILRLTNALAIEQNNARQNSVSAFALNVKNQKGVTLISRKMSISKNTNPELAFASSGIVYFSFDTALVQRGVEVFSKTYPNLYEATPSMQTPNQTPYFYFNPAQFAALFIQEGHKALPIASQGKRRSAFDFHLTSRMAALATHAKMTATVNRDSKAGWQPLNWQK
jgi:uncharacterized protein YfaA (DUF2138 family)